MTTSNLYWDCRCRDIRHRPSTFAGAERKGKAEGGGESVAGTRMSNTDRFRCPEKAGRNVGPLCPARHRGSETLLTLRKLLTAARSTAPVVYSAVRLPTNPTQITDATGQRYFVQMARWRLVHTNEDPPN